MMIDLNVLDNKISDNLINVEEIESLLTEATMLLDSDISLASKYLLRIGRFIYKNKTTELCTRFIDVCESGLAVMTNEDAVKNLYKSLIQIYYTIGLYSLALKYCLQLEEMGLDNPNDNALVYFYTAYICINLKLTDKAFFYNRKYLECINKNMQIYDDYHKILHNLIYLNNNVLLSLNTYDFDRATKNYNKLTSLLDSIKDINIKNKINGILNYVHLQYNLIVNKTCDLDYYLNFIENQIDSPKSFFLDKLSISQHEPFIDLLIKNGRIEEAIKTLKKLIKSLDCTGNRFKYVCKLMYLYNSNDEIKKFISLEEISEFYVYINDMNIDEKSIIDTLFAREEIELDEIHKKFTYVKSNYIKDKLTNCFNRYALYDDFDKYLHGNKTGSIAFIDLNNLKKVNDTLGHDIGDEFIKNFANSAQLFLRSDDSLYRWGGDEFIILSNYTSGNLKNLICDIKNHCNVVEWTPDFCYGIASWPADGKDLDTLMKAADKRMYEQKKRRKNDN